MSLFQNRSLIAEILCKRMNRRWLLTRAANRFFLIASSINVLFAIAVMLLFWEPRSSQSKLLSNREVQFGLGVLGAAAAITGIMLMYGTRKYWEELDDSTAPTKRFWDWILDLGVNIGACFYYFFVYRPKTKQHRLNSNQ